MADQVSAYPLAWPPGFPSSKSRETGQFKTSYPTAIENVRKSLQLFAKDSNRAISNPVLSTNIDFIGQMKDGDPGVAIWFTWDGIQVCIPVDRYTKPASNLQAIHHILEARRVELRHGTLALVRATFEGFKALPAPKHWSTILMVPRNATRDEVNEAYRHKAAILHPDTGGSHDAMSELNAARSIALKEIG